MDKGEFLQKFYDGSLDEAAHKGRLPGTDPKEYRDRQRRKTRAPDIGKSQAAHRSNLRNAVHRKKSIKAFWRGAEGQRLRAHVKRVKSESTDVDMFDTCEMFLEGLADLFNDAEALRETYLIGEDLPEILLDTALAFDVISEFAWYLNQTEDDEEGVTDLEEGTTYESIFEDGRECDTYYFEEDETDLDEVRGEGLGKGGPPQGDGGAEECKCPECGHVAPHKKGSPCSGEVCPKCGASMLGEADEGETNEAHMTAKQRAQAKKRRRSPKYKQWLKKHKKKTSRPGYRPNRKLSRAASRAAKTARR